MITESTPRESIVLRLRPFVHHAMDLSDDTTSRASELDDSDLDEASEPALDLPEARRFDDFKTIGGFSSPVPQPAARHSADWIQDALSERQRTKAEAARWMHQSNWRSWTRAIVHAGQSWFVIALVGPSRPSLCSTKTDHTAGAAIGINAALISIITVWLADLKQGHCSAGWWLNQKFCCWEIEANGMVGSGSSELGCEDWIPWSQWGALSWFMYLLYAVRSFSCAD
jgi:chloride channel 3/4/5